MADEERQDAEDLREGESPEDRDKRFLAEKYGIQAPRRVLGAEAVFDTSVAGGTDADLARSYPAVAAAATKAGSDDEAAMFEADSPNDRKEKYEEVQGEKAEAAGEGEGSARSREQLDEAYSNKDEIKAELDKRGVEYKEADSRDELLDALEESEKDTAEEEKSASEIHAKFRKDVADAEAAGEAPPKQVAPSEQTDAMLAEAAKGEAARENLSASPDAMSDEDRAKAEADGERFVDTSLVTPPEGDISVVGGGKFEDAKDLADSDYDQESEAVKSLKEKSKELEAQQGTPSEAKTTGDDKKSSAPKKSSKK